MRKLIHHFRTIQDCTTLEDFRSTGKIIDANLFSAVRPQERLHDDTMDVLVYVDGIFIEMLKDGKFYYRGAVGILEDLEQGIWDIHKTNTIK